jgi:hypothetical protein
MSAALMTAAPDASALEKVLLQGDLASLNPGQRITYYRELCASLGLNPLTKPFEYLELKGQGGKVSLTLYAKKDCTDQLRNKGDVSCKIISRETVEGVYIVTARATTPGGREEESIGAVPIQKEGGQWKTKDGRREFESDGTFVPLRPEERANAMMKAETKAKRRVTLSLFGLGFTDESEIAQMSGARTISVEDAHSDKLIESGPTGTAGAKTQPRPVPEELELVIGGVRRGDYSSIKGILSVMEKECGELGIGKRYEDMTVGLRSSFPKVIPASVMETFLLDIRDAIVAARIAQEPPRPTDTDEKAGWLPEGMFSEGPEVAK